MRLLSVTRSGQLIFFVVQQLQQRKLQAQRSDENLQNSVHGGYGRNTCYSVVCLYGGVADYEYECETDSDMVKEFLPFFLLEDKFKSRERAVRI